MISVHNIPTKTTPMTIQYVDGVTKVYSDMHIPAGETEEQYRFIRIPSTTLSMRVHNMRVFLDPEKPFEMPIIDTN